MFETHKPNIENMQQYLNNENEKSSGEGPNWWSIPSGMSSVRILPPWDPTGRVALAVYMHPIEYKGEGMSYPKYNWTCVNKTFNKPCNICEGLASLSEAGVDISNYEPNRRQFYLNAIVMHDPNYNQQKGQGTAPGTHVLMRAPKTFYDWIISQITNPMIGDITSVSNGIDVYITKEGQGLGTTYSMTLSPNGRTAIPQEYLDKITSLYNIDDIFSSGFDQKQIDELVGHLKKSAGFVGNSMNNVVNQMAGYQPMQSVAPAPVPGAAQFGYQSSPTPAVSPSFGYQSSSIPTVAPQQFNSVPSTQTNPIPTVPEPVQQTTGGNLPKCFGQYDPGSVNCVVCPHELDCSKSKNA